MTPAREYGRLLDLDRLAVTTGEAAAVWGTGGRTAGRRLRAMEEGGLVRRLRRGLWALDPDLEPLALPPFLTAPFPAYVSFSSALHSHQMIEQIPRRIAVASLDRARTISTTIGVYEIHHLAPELFGGYEGSQAAGYLARPEKALFDSVYVRAAAGGRAFFPELSLPADFDEPALSAWIRRIGSRHLRTIVARRLEEALRGRGGTTGRQRPGGVRAERRGARGATARLPS